MRRRHQRGGDRYERKNLCGRFAARNAAVRTKLIDCPTLGEAVLAFDRLPEGDREQATIKVNVPDGATYTAEEIDRLHVAPKKKDARRGVGQLNRKAAASKSTSA